MDNRNNKFVIQILSVFDIDLPYSLFYEFPKGRTLKFKYWSDAQSFALKKLRQNVSYKIIREDEKSNIIDLMSVEKIDEETYCAA